MIWNELVSMAMHCLIFKPAATQLRLWLGGYLEPGSKLHFPSERLTTTPCYDAVKDHPPRRAQLGASEMYCWRVAVLATPLRGCETTLLPTTMVSNLGDRTKVLELGQPGA